MAFHGALWDGKLGTTAQEQRSIFEASINGQGVLGPGDLLLTGAAPPTIAAGRALIRNTFNSQFFQEQPWLVWNDAPVSLQATAPDPTTIRVDVVGVEVFDSETGGSSSDIVQPVYIPGNPTGLATLDNRFGAASGAALPKNFILIADILQPPVGGGAATFRDRRQIASQTMPYAGFLTGTFVPALPVSNLPVVVQTITPALNNFQVAYSVYVPRRLNSARVRWSYAQGGTALTGNYNIGICDSSGRLLTSTGAVAISGGAGATPIVQLPLWSPNSITLDAGVYWVIIGYSVLAGGSLTTTGVSASATALPVTWNSMLYSASGGTVMPTSLQAGFSDPVSSPPGVTLMAPCVAFS